MDQVFTLPALMARSRAIERIASVLHGLTHDKAWRVSIAEAKPKRSVPQNSYLWGVVYPTILKTGNLQGWTGEDLHEYFLGEHFGWEVIEGMGRRRMKPIRRSSKLNKQEFTDYIAFIQQRSAEFGVYIADPNEKAA